VCGNLDRQPIPKDGILYYSDHPVKSNNPDVLCGNSGKPHAGLEWFLLSGQDGNQRVIWPGDPTKFDPEDTWLNQP
jgi:hypothetical protein